MNTTKKIFSILMAVALICAVFAGCSKQEGGEAEEITAKTMLIAYTEEKAPFIFTNENGELDGFDVKLIKETFESFKGEYENYKFIKVDSNFRIDEDVCYTDENGNEFNAVIMCGGLQKNVGTNNEDYRWSTNLIKNDVITVVKNNSEIADYNGLTGMPAAVVSDFAQSALDKNDAIKSRLASAVAYNDTAEAFGDLEKGIVNAIIIDSFTYNVYVKENNIADYYKVLNGVLDTAEYGFGFSSKTDYSGGFNEAVKEMLSADYGEGDTLTPLITEYFGYGEACAFTFEEESK